MLCSGVNDADSTDNLAVKASKRVFRDIAELSGRSEKWAQTERWTILSVVVVPLLGNEVFILIVSVGPES